jgi:hypothetical protein
MSKRESIQWLIEAIQNDTEWLSTTQGDEIECIGIENLEGILSAFLHTRIKISEQ